MGKRKQMEKDPLQNAKMAATWDAMQWKANKKRSMAIFRGGEAETQRDTERDCKGAYVEPNKYSVENGCENG